jgi:hypothetical protein
MVDSGARITLGSNFPVETMNPLAGFYAVITRKSPTGDSPMAGAWCFLFFAHPARLLIYPQQVP